MLEGERIYVTICLSFNPFLIDQLNRARESRATAEQELLSSTSDKVCELYDGNEVVRIFGQPDMKEFIFRPRLGNRKSHVYGVNDAIR